MRINVICLERSKKVKTNLIKLVCINIIFVLMKRKIIHLKKIRTKYYKKQNRAIGLKSRLFTNCPGDWGPIAG